MNPAPDLTQFPLPEGLKWGTYHSLPRPVYTLHYETAGRSEAWVFWDNGVWSARCRTSTTDQTGFHLANCPTLDEALRYIYNWVMLGMNGGTE